jgi:uncharacterized protein YecT (DUF1311 family)
MTTYPTLEAAREAAIERVLSIVQIEHATQGICYINVGASIEALRRAQRAKPSAEIKRIIGLAANLEAERNTAHKAAIDAAAPGLDALRALQSAWGEYRDAERRAMEHAMRSGVHRKPAKPTQEYSEMAGQYPSAAAYLRAEAWTESSNVDKYSAGKRAMERIVAGEDCEIVMAEMEAEWSSAAADAVKRS